MATDPRASIHFIQGETDAVTQATWEKLLAQNMARADRAELLQIHGHNVLLRQSNERLRREVEELTVALDHERAVSDVQRKRMDEIREEKNAAVEFMWQVISALGMVQDEEDYEGFRALPIQKARADIIDVILDPLRQRDEAERLRQIEERVAGGNFKLWVEAKGTIARMLELADDYRESELGSLILQEVDHE